MGVMNKLNERRKASWPVVNGEPVRPYELPPNPGLDQWHLRQMEDMDRRRDELDRSSMTRVLMRVVTGRREHRGVKWQRVLFAGRLVIEVRHRRISSDVRTDVIVSTPRWELVHTLFRTA